MQYINNIYDYKTVDVKSYFGLKTRQAIIAQGFTLKVVKDPDRPWLTSAYFEETAPGVNHTVKLNVKAEPRSILELHICNILESQDSIKYDISVEAEEYSSVTLSVVSLRGKNVEVNINVNIVGQNATVKLPGLLLPSLDETFTYHSNVVHSVGGSSTIQKVRTIADKNGVGDFFGIIKVLPNAQKSVTEQVNNNILLSSDSRVESKPQLEIYADDVKCSHGSTTGMLDKEALFYMRSRGVSEKNAQNLLLKSFIDEIVNNISSDKEYVNLVQEHISNKLEM